MADRKMKLPQVLTDDGGLAELLLKDNGDGTFSLAVASSGSGASADKVQGNVADAAADSGNPVKVGAKYNSTPPTYTNGQRADLQTNSKGDLRVQPLMAFGSAWNALQAAGNVGDGVSGASQLVVAQQVNNGTTYDFLRTPNIFRSASATASGNTAVWTPGASKKFRLMKYKIEITANATLASGAVLTVKFQDSTTDNNLTHSVYVPAAGSTNLNGDWDSGWIDLGNGFKSVSANNVLNINLSAALTAGNVRVIVCGTEE